jgi:hypothetical protein
MYPVDLENNERLCEYSAIIVLNIGDMRAMEVYVYVYNPYLWMILYFTITMGINGCILDFTTKYAQMICLLDFTTIMRLSTHAL